MLLRVWGLVLVSGCGVAHATNPPAPSPQSSPPPVERACTQDSDCAVASVSLRPGDLCCPSCGTTPGTRTWHIRLRAFCGRMDLSACPPLACPMGPTRAICRSGQCEATFLGPDGGPSLIVDQSRCLPALVCSGWRGCALLTGNEQNGWFVYRASGANRGDNARVGNVCTSGTCDAAQISTTAEQCPPNGVLQAISSPGYACQMVNGECTVTGNTPRSATPRTR